MRVNYVYQVLIVFLVLSSYCYAPLECAASSSEPSTEYILITGFEPFGDYDINPSECIVETLDGSYIAGYEIIGIVLPVDFEDAVECILESIDDQKPCLVLSLGLDERTTTIDVEKVAVNLKRYARNELPLWFLPRFLSRGDPLFQWSPVNAQNIKEALTTDEIPAKLSLSAGTYVCNAVFYHSLLYCQENNLHTTTGFLHVPLLDTQSPDGLSLSMMLDAVNITLACCLEK